MRPLPSASAAEKSSRASASCTQEAGVTTGRLCAVDHSYAHNLCASGSMHTSRVVVLTLYLFEGHFSGGLWRARYGRRKTLQHNREEHVPTEPYRRQVLVENLERISQWRFFRSFHNPAKDGPQALVLNQQDLRKRLKTKQVSCTNRLVLRALVDVTFRTLQNNEHKNELANAPQPHRSLEPSPAFDQSARRTC